MNDEYIKKLFEKGPYDTFLSNNDFFNMAFERRNRIPFKK